MKISDAAAASGCHLETIRYYERIGLLPRPGRSGNGYRVYGLPDIERLRFIARGRDLGFSLEEVRSLLQLAGDEGLSCVDVDRLARSHLSDIRARMTDLQRMANELERVIASCHGGQRAECTILSTLRRPASEDSLRKESSKSAT
ncbi:MULTISPECIES: MerR family transcriptional regulator [Stenotrophomonas]|uniref:MerR family transcriptional regulator n=1 Tax=Stenotrophomonas TaxID=40323 RepID=UPI001A51EBF1|nr:MULTISPECIES: helix-turn-helix domain-containing protein [Stenotrophomonas]MBK5592798.1 helix-turn-helix domain-containing protein [Stenotrophomonas maltophilia]MCO7485629.1 helix-turn-helix domain-containing protein [Stenotrophomonas maltophilia]MCU1188923.1 helix-turn-helix domain-containing protein [Stenotrophomonas maltophilia]MDQ7280405.1 helix-turn-helix domain-containing protein [Stenotrophomonas sp. Sm6012]UGB14223.1 helix-turn-helix domain-containing protein [Stenotrophomonas malto